MTADHTPLPWRSYRGRIFHVIAHGDPDYEATSELVAEVYTKEDRDFIVSAVNASLGT